MTNTQPTDKAAVEEQPRRSWIVYLPIVIFAGIAIMFGFALFAGDPSRIPSALIGKPAPTRALPPLEGLTRQGQPVPSFSGTELANGEPAIVNFWASWCGPCVDEHPLLIELAQKTGVPIYGVNYKDPGGNGLKFLQRLGNPYAGVGVDADGSASIDWGVYGMPETFVIDGQGRITYKHIGPITRATLESRILPAIAKARTTE
ncbi:MAG: DsbE family thiol:disulfide interchange protein [Pseudomonadota bacterium]